MALSPKNSLGVLTVVAVVILIAAFTYSPERSMAVAQQPVAAPETVFFDDFTGPTLDRSKWRVEVTGRTVNDEQQAYVDSPETISLVRGDEAEGASNGALVLQPRYQPGFMTPQKRKFDFISGRIDTRGKMDFAFGTASARIKLSPGPGLWPAFWALGSGR
jgi:beta-glucanase (GH16 family)